MSDNEKHAEQNMQDNLAVEIGRRLLKARTGLGLSQQLLHEKTKVKDPDGVGISRAVLSLYERGVNRPGSRELIILCAALHVSPNWLLLGSESPGKTLQPSLVFLQGDELNISARLALGILALAPEERDALASLIFSMLTKSLGDSRLSSLMVISKDLAESLYEKISADADDFSPDVTLKQLIDRFIESSADAIYTNYGTLRPLIPEEDLDDFDPDSPPPPRDLSDAE